MTDKLSILEAALFTPMGDGTWGLPLMLWGDPGVSKSATILALGRRWRLPVEELCPGERGEGQFGVVPVPSGTNGEAVLAYPPPEWVRGLRTEHGECGIVFLDEITTAPPALQPALLGLIQRRRIGAHAFGARVRVLGAANPSGQAAGGWDLAPPVANRLGHMDWGCPDHEAWGAWLIGGQEDEATRDPLAREAEIWSQWPAAWAGARGIVSGFIRRRPELLHKMPPDGDPAQSRAWPSPRTWEYAARALAAAKVHHLGGIEEDMLVAAFVGEAAAGELAAWVDAQDLPDPADVLDGRAKWAHDPARLDRTEAVLGACAALVVPDAGDPKRVARTAALWGEIAKVVDDAKDVAIPACRALVRAKLQRGPEAILVLAKLRDVLVASQGGGQ